MQPNIYVLFNMVGKASHSSIIRGLLNYLDQELVPPYYRDPQCFAGEMNRVLKNLATGYLVLEEMPKNLNGKQLLLTLEVEHSDGDEALSLQGNFRVFAEQTNEPLLEEIFRVIFKLDGRPDTLNRDLYLYGEPIDSKVYPPPKSEGFWQRLSSNQKPTLSHSSPQVLYR